MAPIAPLNADYERRSFWQASMPALPDRSGRDLPGQTEVVVIGGGYAGVNAARELAARGVARVRLRISAPSGSERELRGRAIALSLRWVTNGRGR